MSNAALLLALLESRLSLACNGAKNIAANSQGSIND
jgi:DNA-binding transcriptional regulator YdaS (Cro superfamily)